MRALLLGLCCACGRSGFDALDGTPHVPFEEQQIGDTDLTLDQDFVAIDTTTTTVSGAGPAELVKLRQADADIDVVLLRVRDLAITENAFVHVTGRHPLIVLARRVTIAGSFDASALAGIPGAGGGRPTMGDPGEGAAGLVGQNNQTTGGGGGGFGGAGGSGGAIDCTPTPIAGGASGAEHGDRAITILVGGGAGGRGGARCATQIAEAGGGGGALQISAVESIEITSTGSVRAGGGGGAGGAGGNSCPLTDGAGAGGGAGGAIYLDAPEISNAGELRATGGGGGGGGDDTSGAGAGLDGAAGSDATGSVGTGSGGAGAPTKGTTGGNGAPADPIDAVAGLCSAGQLAFNTGGGGGGLGRIVIRGTLSPFGEIEPPPLEIAR